MAVNDPKCISHLSDDIILCLLSLFREIKDFPGPREAKVCSEMRLVYGIWFRGTFSHKLQQLYIILFLPLYVSIFVSMNIDVINRWVRTCTYQCLCKLFFKIHQGPRL